MEYGNVCSDEAYNLVKEGILTKEEAICKVNPERFEELLFPQIEPKDRKAATMIAKGSAASPGAACGKVCFTQDEALAAKANKEDAILVTVMTSQEDVKGMKASRGVLTTTGTKVSHAAIMAIAWGIPAVVGASEITIDKAAVPSAARKNMRNEIFRHCLDKEPFSLYIEPFSLLYI